MKNKVLKTFLRYSSLSMLSAIGMSCYVLADTLFIANGVGPIGLTALNLILPIYNVIFGIGLLLGIGGATKFSILRSQGKDEEANHYYCLAIIFGVLISIPFIIIAIFFSKEVVTMLGADKEVMETAIIYFRTIVLFTPFFILSHAVAAFVRNDNNPKIASIAMLSGTLFNIVFDYILVFPCGLGMFGAAIATSVSPIVTLCICMFHFFSKDNHLKFKFQTLESSKLWSLIKVGTPAFITELSAGIVIFAFNIIILSIGGNIAVASYGIVSNLAIVVVSLYTGLSQGLQPLVSHSFGKNETAKIYQYLKYSLILGSLISLGVYIFTLLSPGLIISLFNNENNKTMSEIAKTGLFIYFSGFFFVGINMISTSYFASTERIKQSFTISLLRSGFVIIPILLILSHFFGLTGVWFSYPLSEFIILILVCFFHYQQSYKKTMSFKPSPKS